MPSPKRPSKRKAPAKPKVGKHGCTGTTRKGLPCDAHPLRDNLPKVCLAHADATTRESVGFIAANGKAGRKRVPGFTEVQRRLVEENAAAVQRPYWRVLGYDVKIGPDGPYLVEIEGGGAKLYGTSKDGVVRASSYDDLGAQMSASDKLQDRTHGRPRQAIEHTGADGGPVEIVPVAQDRGATVAALLAGTGAVPESE
jgi:hypothetical protein